MKSCQDFGDLTPVDEPAIDVSKGAAGCPAEHALMPKMKPCNPPIWIDRTKTAKPDEDLSRSHKSAALLSWAYPSMMCVLR